MIYDHKLETCFKGQLGIFEGVGTAALKDTPPMSREQYWTQRQI